MTISALIISLFIQFGFIRNEAELQRVSEQQQQSWAKEIIEDDLICQ